MCDYATAMRAGARPEPERFAMITHLEMTPEIKAVLERIAQHGRDYISSGGTKGHVFSFENNGGRRLTTCLLLRTVGRKSGQARTLPLIYGNVRGEAVIVASKGGAPEHPCWYFNVRNGGEVAFQIGTQAWRANWREPQGAERAEVWKYMEELFPPYKDYQASTQREIPIVMLTPLDDIEVFRE